MPEDEQLVDWEQVDMIADGYTPDFLDIFREFAAEMPRLIGALEEASADPAAVARVAHQLKGSAANFGFQALSKAAAVIEATAKAGSLDHFPERLAAARTVLDASMAECQAKRGLTV